ncbi:MAG TPA: Ig-like domain-containing protein [Gemmatimonadaceae bacterium]
MRRHSMFFAFALLAACSAGCTEPLLTPSLSASTIVVQATSQSVAVGQTTNVVVTVKDAAGNAVTGAVVALASGAPTVATVAADGTVNGISAGSAQITASVGAIVGQTTIVVGGTPGAPVPAGPPGVVALPAATVDVSMPSVTGATIAVPNGGDLQAAINQAKPGDVIELAAGATYSGAFVLPNKGSASGWIIIRPASGTSLPSPGTRMTPALAQAARLPIISSVDAGNAIQTALGAHGYRIIGVEITLGSSVTRSYGLVGFGMDKSQGQTTLASAAYNLILDRVYVHGTTTASLRRCVALNSGSAGVIDSWLSDCHDDSADAQAIGGWNGPGPFLIRNNELQGSTENIMFGGSDAGAAELSPADITVQRNHLFKPAEWIGGPWHIKNLFELKNAQRVLVEENVLEGSWPRDWDGTAVAMKSVNQDCGPVPAGTLDVTFRRNLIRNTGSGINLDAGSSCGGPIMPMSRVLIQNNLLLGVNSTTYSGKGNGFFTGGALTDITLDHNTVTWVGAGGIAVNMDNYDHPTIRFTLTNNIFATVGGNGVQGQATGWPGPTITHFMPDGHVAGNVFAVGTAYLQGNYNSYPVGNTALINEDPSLSALGFVDGPGGDVHLQLVSPAKGKATDGGDAGADVSAVMTAATAALAGTP